MYSDGMRGGSRRPPGRRRFLRSALDVCLGVVGASWRPGVAWAAPASHPGLVASGDLRTAASWASARSTPLRGQYQSFDSTLYLQQRLESHASGVDVFAVSTFNPEQARLFHEMQDSLEQTYGPDLTRFLWMHEILGRLPFELNSVGQEIVDFDLSSTRGAFVTHMVELAGYFHENYLTLDGRYYPISIWKTDTIRGDFVRAVEEARSAVASCCGKAQQSASRGKSRRDRVLRAAARSASDPAALGHHHAPQSHELQRAPRGARAGADRRLQRRSIVAPDHQCLSWTVTVLSADDRAGPDPPFATCDGL